MVSGRYMGELFGLALAELLGEDREYGFTSIDMSNIVLDESDDRTEAAQIIKQHTGQIFGAAECETIKELVSAIIIRSARIATATYAGIIWHLAEDGKIQKQHIAIDGSVYEKMPLVKENVMRALYDILGEDAAKVDTVLENGGSGLGAAIAACMSQKA
jgi:hexokinase